MENAMEFIYTSKEVGVSVGIATSTLRAWCLKLEAAGYPFKRTDDGKRAFFERDITALRTMKDFLDKKHPMEYTVEQIVSRFKAKTHSDSDENASDAKMPVAQTALQERFPTATELINEIRQVVREEVRQEVAAALEEHIERRDRQLTEVLRELQESKQRKWWQRLFRG